MVKNKQEADMKSIRYVYHEDIVGNDAHLKTNVEIKWLSRFCDKEHKRKSYASILRMRNFTKSQSFERNQFLKKHDAIFCNRCLIMWDSKWQTKCPNCERIATAFEWIDIVYPSDFPE